MQSIEYTIKSYEPLGEQSIENISSTNQQSYWQSSSDSATIKIAFAESPITEFMLSASSSVNFVLIGWDSSKDISNILESSLIISGGKMQQAFPISIKTAFCECELQISTIDSSKLRIYCLIIKTHREKIIENQKNRTSLNAMKAASFYQSNNGSISNKTPQKTFTVQESRQTTLFGDRSQINSPGNSEGKFNRIVDSPKLMNEPRKIQENSQNNRQRILKLGLNKQKSPSSSYQNILAPRENAAYVLCCKEEEAVKKCIEELCAVLGICYLSDLEEGVTHMIYEGNNSEIINLSRIMDVVIITKQWLIDCMLKRESIQPDHYKRVF